MSHFLLCYDGGSTQSTRVILSWEHSGGSGSSKGASSPLRGGAMLGVESHTPVSTVLSLPRSIN